MRLRLPPRPPVDYQVRRDNYTWGDHILRVQLTAGLIAWFQPDTILDPACGDGTIVAAAHRVREISGARLADISMPNFYHVGTMMRQHLPESTIVMCQSVEETLADPSVYFDLVVLTEILEHVEDPDNLLRLARERARILVASSPMLPNTGVEDDNPEHLWQFDLPGYEEMLRGAGWDPVACVPIMLRDPGFKYDFQLWAAR